MPIGKQDNVGTAHTRELNSKSVSCLGTPLHFPFRLVLSTIYLNFMIKINLSVSD